jgi:ubiquinone/menaquinone biosynthesis C-methylase UbiE
LNPTEPTAPNVRKGCYVIENWWPEIQMSVLAQRLKNRYFKQDHPYRVFEREVERYLRPEHTLLDAGCGRTAPILAKYSGNARRLIGIDTVEFDPSVKELELYRADLGTIPLEHNCVDVVMARSVMEHVTDPARVYAEIYRVLKPGGHFIFLTANLWDYASLVAKMIPNRFHPWIVSRTEGREEQDVFPVAYRTNTRSAIDKWTKQAGFEIVSFVYLGQYPSYFMFNGFLFLLATSYEKLIGKIPALNSLQGWIFVTLRKPAASHAP